MKISLSNQALAAITSDLLAIGVKSDSLKKDATVKQLDALTHGSISRLLEDATFKGDKGETLTLTTPTGLKCKRLVLIGLGKDKVTESDSRFFGTRAAQLQVRGGSLSVLALSGDDADLRALAEGLTTGAYKYTPYLTGDRRPKRVLDAASVVLATKAGAGAKSSIENGVLVGESMNLVRDWVNCPPNDMHPTALAAAAKKVSATARIECKVLDKKAIEKKKMNLLLAVARGSGQDPRFIHMTYKPKGANKKTKKVVFVGKGLTFDSGGLCIKPAKGMLDMKCDMAGGALTIATVFAAARLKLNVEVHGIVPSTENMTGDNAYRPGDVFTSYDGKTVEIINTDAEGRLILADALAYARELNPDYLVDHATLTGACMVALGAWTAGLFSNDDELAKKYAQAGEDAGESYWRLPLNDDLRDSLKSDIADLKHMGDGYGGSITAALFLREFVGKTKWVHLDIAGPAYSERAHGIYPKGGTGFGVLTALRFLESLGG